MPSFNSATFIGHLGAKPDLNTTQSGKQVANASLAVTDYRTKETLWVKLAFWGNNAENAEKYLDKGAAIMTVGPINLEEFTGKDGMNRTKIAQNVLQFVMLPKNDAQTQAPAVQNRPAPTAGVDDDVPF